MKNNGFTRFYELGCLGLLVCLLSACTVGPDYVRPDSDIPDGFKEAADDRQTPWDADWAAMWQQAQPQEETERGPWWEIFGDPLLDALIEEVQISNQDLRVAEAQYRQAQAMTDAARAGYFPAIGAGAGVTRSDTGSGPGSRSNLTFNASWEIDLWGKVRRSVEASEADLDRSAANLGAARLSAQSSLAYNYFQLRILDAERALLEQTVAEYEKSLALTQNQYAVGVAQRSDVAQAETQLKSAQVQVLNIGVSRAQFEHAIALLIGKAPADFSLEAVDSVTAVLPVIPVSLPSTLLERRPDIAAAERQMAAANAKIGVAQAAYFPSLNLAASLGWQGNSSSNLLSLPLRLWSLAPSLAFTLFDGGARQAQSDVAVAVYDQTVAAYRQTVLSAFQEVEDNLAALRILAHEAEAQASAARSARETVTLVNNQYKAGTVSYLNVVSAQTTALNNERAELQILRQQFSAGVALIKALGGGWQGIAAEEGKTETPMEFETVAEEE